MIEQHPDGRARGRHVLRHGSQQVRGGAARTLIPRHGELVGNARRRIGEIGRERRGFVQVVVPQQAGSREGRAVVGHLVVPDVIRAVLRDGQTDTVARIEMKPRDAGFDRRRDPDAGNRIPLIGTAGCSGEARRQKRKKELSFHHSGLFLRLLITKIKLFMLFTRPPVSFCNTIRRVRA